MEECDEAENYQIITSMNKKLGLSIAVFLLAFAAGYFSHDSNSALGAGGAFQQTPTFYLASSTTYTLTTTSQRLLATSTAKKRLAAAIQPTNCTQGAGHAVFLSLNQDAPAVQGTGLAAYASTTLQLEDYPGMSSVVGSVTGITGAGTCTVLVTEWRSQF
jgi:hypothetical protein